MNLVSIALIAVMTSICWSYFNFLTAKQKMLDWILISRTPEPEPESRIILTSKLAKGGIPK